MSLINAFFFIIGFCMGLEKDKKKGEEGRVFYFFFVLEYLLYHYFFFTGCSIGVIGPYLHIICSLFCIHPFIAIGCLGHCFNHCSVNEELHLADTIGVTGINTECEITQDKCILCQGEGQTKEVKEVEPSRLGFLHRHLRCCHTSSRGELDQPSIPTLNFI